MSREYSQEYWKKQDEMDALGHFLSEYASITGNVLDVKEVSESPDVICTDASGGEVLSSRRPEARDDEGPARGGFSLAEPRMWNSVREVGIAKVETDGCVTP